MNATTTEREQAIQVQRHFVRHMFAAALCAATPTPKVPVVRVTAERGPVIESQPIGNAVLDTLDLAIVNDKLLFALRHSRCPMLAEVKTALINAYADAQAPLVPAHQEAEVV